MRPSERGRLEGVEKVNAGQAGTDRVGEWNRTANGASFAKCADCSVSDAWLGLVAGANDPRTPQKPLRLRFCSTWQVGRIVLRIQIQAISAQWPRPHLLKGLEATWLFWEARSTKIGGEIMSRTQHSAAAVFLVVAFSLVLAVRGQERPDGKVRAVSLRVLQKMCQETEGKDLTDEVRNLGTLGRVDGVIIDRAGKDVLLIGVSASEAAPPLLTEDFVVALRNAWSDKLETPESLSLGFLGCSIDHDPGTFQVLMQAASRIAMHDPMPGDVDRWNRLCEKPMTVSISDVPVDSHFARVLFEADLALKRLALGMDSPDPSFRSLLYFIKEQAELVEKTGGRAMMMPLLHVWLVPGANSYAEAGSTTWLDSCPVVMSDEECIVMEGKLACTGRIHPPVRKFADHFSSQFPQFVKTRPEFARLAALYRFVALARIFRYKGIERSISYLLNSYPVATQPAPASPAGVPRMIDIAKPKLAFGIKIAKWKIPACGGIRMDIDVEQAEVTTRPALEELQAKILGARPAPETLWWEQ